MVSSYKILVVDDVVFARKNLSDVCTEQGWTVVGEAENGREALERYMELKPDLVTMDLTMPEVDGLTAIESIINYDPRARIVVCSLCSEQETILKAIQTGARDFVLKPFQKERLVSAVQRAMAR